MIARSSKENILFIECVEALGCSDTVLDKESSICLWQLFKKNIPTVFWGRIDWKVLKDVITVADPNQILFALKQLIGNSFDFSVYIFWNDASLPIVKADLLRIVTFFDDVACVAPDIWLWSTSLNYIVEIFHDGEITIGLLPKNSVIQF